MPSAETIASTLSITSSCDPSLKTATNVWGGNRAGYSLLDLLSSRGALKNTRVLGIGSGQGLLELTASCMGAHVLATDLPVALTLLNTNAKTNAHVISGGGGTFNVAALPWGETSVPSDVTAQGPFSMLLASDCIFWPELFDPLITTFTAISVAQGSSPPHIFFALEPRSPRESAFFKKLEDAGFDFAKIDEVHAVQLEKLVSGAVAVFWAQLRQTKVT
jgi:hypothetical protein